MENKKFWKVYYEHLEKAAAHAGMYGVWRVAGRKNDCLIFPS